MTQLDVYDPAQCCATGVCGPSVDDSLAQFASLLESIKQQGVAVSRYNLSQQPGAFVQNTVIRSALEEHGVACLPVVVLDGKVVSQGRYPTKSELGSLVGAAAAPVQSCCGPAAESKRCCG